MVCFFIIFLVTLSDKIKITIRKKRCGIAPIVIREIEANQDMLLFNTGENVTTSPIKFTLQS